MEEPTTEWTLAESPKRQEASLPIIHPLQYLQGTEPSFLLLSQVSVVLRFVVGDCLVETQARVDRC